MSIPINKNNGDILTASEFNAISQAISGDKLPYDPNTGDLINDTYGVGSPDFKIKNINGENIANYKSLISQIKFGMWRYPDQIPPYHVAMVGQVLSRETYSDLYNHLLNNNVRVYGTSGATTVDGSGDGSTTFHMINVTGGASSGNSGRFLKCVNSQLVVLGSQHNDATRRPRTSNFTGSMSGSTNTTGNHKHIGGLPENMAYLNPYGAVSGLVTSSMREAGGNGAEGDEYLPYTSTTGNHSHSVSVSGSITGGGDSLTQPHCIGVTAIMYAGV
jgi:hypothetical protein